MTSASQVNSSMNLESAASVASSSFQCVKRTAREQPLQQKRVRKTVLHKGPKPKRLRASYVGELSCGPGNHRFDDVSPARTLCAACSEIDFEEFLLNSNNWPCPGIPVLRHEDSTDCELCFFFDQAKGDISGQHQTERKSLFELKSYGTNSYGLHRFVVSPKEGWPRGLDIVFRRVGDSAQVHGRVLRPNTFDADRIKGWMEFCDSKHKGNCKKQAPVSNLTVIDCDSRRLVTVDKMQEPYVTVSYVWGHPSSIGTTSPNELPDILETTIADSIAVVAALGLKYLWVDRYCIPQDNAMEKHSQIKRMDEIYANSALTIIAAAGINADFGLPGVSQRARKSYPHIRIGSFMLICLPPEIQGEIKHSFWNTRGWTYQEGLLARRRLVFTESQVYFQCAGMHCPESLCLPLKSLHIKSLERFRQDCEGFFPRNGIGKEPEEILERINEYKSRQLSYQSDALAAFQGILTAYQTFGVPIRHFCGVIIFPPSLSKRTAKFKDFEMFSFGLSWYSSGPAIRRHEFPSWSWLGWQFNARTSLRLELDPLKGRPEALFVAEVELTTGALVPLRQTIPFIVESANDPTIHRVLVVDAWLVDSSTDGDANLSGMQDLGSIGESWDVRNWKELCVKSIAAFELAGLHPRNETQAADITAMLLGSFTEGYFLSALLLRYNRARNLYERLPGSVSLLNDMEIIKKGHARLGGLKLVRRRIRLG